MSGSPLATHAEGPVDRFLDRPRLLLTGGPGDRALQAGEHADHVIAIAMPTQQLFEVVVDVAHDAVGAWSARCGGASPGDVEHHHRKHKHALPLSAPIDFDVVHGFGSRLYFGLGSRWTAPNEPRWPACTRVVVESAGATEQLADDVGRLLICALGPMRVDLHRGGAIGVAQPGGHGRNGYAGVEELRGLEVAEVVQPN